MTESDSADARLAALGIELPTPAVPAANYTPTLLVGNLLFVSGQLPLGPAGIVTGKLGLDLDVAAGKEAARLAAIGILAQAKAALGDLERIVRVARITGMINGVPDFEEPHLVLNGASDFLVAVLGDRGRHTRSVMVAAGMPLNAAILVDAIIETR